MPIYEYRCSSCGHELEALQKFSDPPLVACPSCRKEALVKLVSAAGFQLKGTGWYATDFKGSSSAKPAAKAGGDAKPADAKTETKSDAKPAGGTDGGGSGSSASTASTPGTAAGSGSAS